MEKDSSKKTSVNKKKAVAKKETLIVKKEVSKGEKIEKNVAKE